MKLLLNRIGASVLFFSIFASVSARAHIDPGAYTGSTDASEVCGFTAGERFFENNLPHPLNERIRIEINGDTYVVAHPAVIDAAIPQAAFNHDIFQGVLPTQTGAKALIIDMIHEEGKDGPTSFHLITHNWKTKEATVIHCKELRLKK